jgi:hypothetical protein
MNEMDRWEKVIEDVARRVVTEELCKAKLGCYEPKYTVESIFNAFSSERRNWSPFESKHLEECLDGLITNLELKFGRTRIGISYKIAHILKARGVRVF